MILLSKFNVKNHYKKFTVILQKFYGNMLFDFTFIFYNKNRKNEIEGEEMIKNGWYHCYYCRRKLFPVEPDTKIYNLHHKCKFCKQINIININIEPRAYEPGADTKLI